MLQNLTECKHHGRVQDNMNNKVGEVCISYHGWAFIYYFICRGIR